MQSSLICLMTHQCNANDVLHLHCCVSLLHHLPLVAAVAVAAAVAAAAVGAGGDQSGDDAAITSRSALFGSVCLNVNSVSRTDICDNQEPAKHYSLQPGGLSS